MSTFILYDLAGRDQSVRPSPFCWLAKYALLHKGMAFDTVALGFLPKSAYPDPDYGLLPILKHGDELIRGSDKIIDYLDDIKPEPRLTPLQSSTDGAVGALEFARSWLSDRLFPALGPALFYRVANALGETDQAYFRESREKRFGKSLTEVAAQPGLREKTDSAMVVLDDQLQDLFLCGKEPGLADYTVFSPLMWKNSITDDDVFTMPTKLGAWHERMLDLYGGLGRQAACANC